MVIKGGRSMEKFKDEFERKKVPDVLMLGQ